MKDNYNDIPEFYWFMTRSNNCDEDVSFWSCGGKYVGFGEDPDDSIVYRYNLRYVGFGDMDWISKNTRKLIG